jgi:hypothetical protein
MTKALTYCNHNQLQNIIRKKTISKIKKLDFTKQPTSFFVDKKKQKTLVYNVIKSDNIHKVRLLGQGNMKIKMKKQEDRVN